MKNIIKKFIEHGVVTIDYPNKPLNNKFITGRPIVDEILCTMCGECIERCPTSAIVRKSAAVSQCNDVNAGLCFNIDECIFCSLCADICSTKAIKMTTDFELSKTSRNDLRNDTIVIDERAIPTDDYLLIGSMLKEKVGKAFGRSLQIREVDAGSCNGCDNEVNALNSPYNDIERFGISFVASPRHADMLLVTGPVTRNMELALIKAYNATPDPKLVVAVGACACSGGIFKDSYATKNGVDSILPVDVYIPGCPPRPQALMYGILMAIERKK